MICSNPSFLYEQRENCRFSKSRLPCGVPRRTSPIALFATRIEVQLVGHRILEFDVRRLEWLIHMLALNRMLILPVSALSSSYRIDRGRNALLPCSRGDCHRQSSRSARVAVLLRSTRTYSPRQHTQRGLVLFQCRQELLGGGLAALGGQLFLDEFQPRGSPCSLEAESITYRPASFEP